MSKILDFAKKHNIPLTNEEQEKLCSIEVALILSNTKVENIENNDIIYIMLERYHYFVLFENQTLKIEYYNMKEHEKFCKDNLISTIEFICTDLNERIKL